MAAHAVFSIATNGYELQFENCIRSHVEYCKRLGVPYFLVKGSPPWGIAAHDSAWLKITSLDKLLRRFNGGVLYLDADCEVLSTAEDFRVCDSQSPHKSLFAANDFSNRLNAAVIYCRGTESGRRLMKALVLSSWLPSMFLPRADKNLYENGHFIWICKNSQHVQVLSQEWNSGRFRETRNPNIIHHGGDVMREISREKPASLMARLYNSWTGFRLPFHMMWYRRNLSCPYTID